MLSTFFITLSALCVMIALICEWIRRWAGENYRLSLLDNATFVQFCCLILFVLFAILSCITIEKTIEP